MFFFGYIYCVGIIFFLHIKGDDLLVGGEGREREHNQSSRCKYVGGGGGGGFGVFFLAKTSFFFFEKKKKNQKKQKIKKKFGSSF